MKLLCNILIFFFFIPLLSFGDNFKYVDKKDLIVYSVINLSIGYKDYLISPLVSDNLNLSIDSDSRLKNFGFDTGPNQIVATDTLVIDKNDFFEVVSADSILKFRHSDSRLNDSMIISEPFYYYLARAYKKKCICHFSKILFSKDSEYAIAEYFIGCGMNDGMGKRLLLKKTKDKWIVIDTLSFLGS
jgi:hypothetical protein